MTIQSLALRAGRTLHNNSPLILTALGVAGTVTTAYLTGTATVKAVRLLDEESLERNKDRYHQNPTPPFVKLDNKEKFLLLYKLYIPAVGTGVMTITCIILATRIGARRAAAVAAAYAVSERTFHEYKDKVIEKIGEKDEKAIRDEIALDNLRRNPPPPDWVAEGLVWFMEATTHHYFQSTMEVVKRAEVDSNFEILHHDYINLSDFRTKLGLPRIDGDDEVGWNTDGKLELNITPGIWEERNLPVFVMSYARLPFPLPGHYC